MQVTDGEDNVQIQGKNLYVCLLIYRYNIIPTIL